MDIVTHAGIGLALASPFLDTQPELAVGFVVGAVLPDLDALSRLCGKRAFIRFHQTWTHALPLQIVFSLVAGIVAKTAGVNGVSVAVGLFAGLALHTLLDLSNTLGVKALYPISRKRFCLEWVFFIDAFVLLSTIVAITLVIPDLLNGREVSKPVVRSFALWLLAYFSMKAALRWRAGRHEGLSFIPSALLPWRFFVARCGSTTVSLVQINALNGREKTLLVQPIHDAEFAHILKEHPDYRVMRALSPAYRIVSAMPASGGTHLLCRDLRTRNFQTTFGDLEVFLDENGRITRSEFHV